MAPGFDDPGLAKPGLENFPGLLLCLAPPGRGLPLLVVKGRARPLSLRKGLGALERGEKAGFSKRGRPGELGRLGLSAYGRGDVERGAAERGSKLSAWKGRGW